MTARRRNIRLLLIVLAMEVAGAVVFGLSILRGREFEFVNATVTEWFDHFDEKGNLEKCTRQFRITNGGELRQLAAFFPGLGQGRRSNRAAGCIPWLKVEFRKADGSILTIHVLDDREYQTWFEGLGDWPVKGDIRGFVGELQETHPSTTQPAG